MMAAMTDGAGWLEGSAFDDALADARQGGEVGLTALFRAFHPRILRYLRSRDRRRADDVAGETWLAVASQITAFRGDAGAFSAWLFTIARQRLADQHRTAARRGTDPVAEVPEPHAVASAEQTGLDHLNAQQAVDFIVANLSADHADVDLLRPLGGLTAAQVAGVLGREEGWVRVTHHRATHRLRERMPPRNL